MPRRSTEYLAFEVEFTKSVGKGGRREGGKEGAHR